MCVSVRKGKSFVPCFLTRYPPALFLSSGDVCRVERLGVAGKNGVGWRLPSGPEGGKPNP